MKKKITVDGKEFVWCENHNCYYLGKNRCVACTVELMFEMSQDDTGRASRMNESYDLMSEGMQRNPALHRKKRG